jgi:hypothetical protein
MDSTHRGIYRNNLATHCIQPVVDIRIDPTVANPGRSKRHRLRAVFGQ